MRKNFDFKKVDKLKVAVISVVIFVAVVALGNGIATSFGTMDSDMAKDFYKGMSIPFFRGGTAYTILDAYISILSYAIPLGVLLCECIMKGIKVYKPNGGLARHYTGVTNWILVIFTVAYSVFATVFLASYALFDEGFGVGFTVEFLTGKEYIIPIYIVSILINATVYGVQVYYYHNKGRNKDDFLASKPGRPALTILLFMIYIYVPNLIIKYGMGRPYGYNVHGTDGLKNSSNQFVNSNTDIKGPLERIKEIYGNNPGGYFDHYMHHQSKFNYGGRDGTGSLSIAGPAKDQNFYWYEMGQGFFNKGGKYYSSVMHEQAFPSGHVDATSSIILVSNLWFWNKPKNKKTNMGRIIIYSIGAIYFLDIIFALQVSSSHGGSDTMFSIAFVPIAYYCSKFTISAIMKKLNKTYKTDKG